MVPIPSQIAVQYFLNNIPGAHPSGKVYKGRCPVCGDSDKQFHKHLYLLNHTTKGWIVYCHKCECSMTLWNLIKNYYPEAFPYLKQQCFQQTFSEKPDPEALVAAKIKENKQDINYMQKFLVNNCFPIVANHDKPERKQIAIKCIKSMMKRFMHDWMIKTLYYCYKNEEENGWFYKDRIIIPFYDSNRNIYYFQARATLPNQHPKYINWAEPGKEQSKPEFNEHGVDKSKHVFLIEGLINSTFVNNAVSTLGVKISDEKLDYLEKKYPKPIYVLDNDKYGRDWTERLLRKKRTCFVMPKEYRGIKDLNDLAIFLAEKDLTKFIKSNCYNGIQGLLKLKELE